MHFEQQEVVRTLRDGISALPSRKQFPKPSSITSTRSTKFSPIYNGEFVARDKRIMDRIFFLRKKATWKNSKVSFYRNTCIFDLILKARVLAERNFRRMLVCIANDKKVCAQDATYANENRLSLRFRIGTVKKGCTYLEVKFFFGSVG